VLRVATLLLQHPLRLRLMTYSTKPPEVGGFSVRRYNGQVGKHDERGANHRDMFPPAGKPTRGITTAPR
jgi:hypothetical protein